MNTNLELSKPHYFECITESRNCHRNLHNLILQKWLLLCTNPAIYTWTQEHKALGSRFSWICICHISDIQSLSGYGAPTRLKISEEASWYWQYSVQLENQTHILISAAFCQSSCSHHKNWGPGIHYKSSWGENCWVSVKLGKIIFVSVRVHEWNKARI